MAFAIPVSMSASLGFIRTIEDDEEVDVDESDTDDEVKYISVWIFQNSFF